MIELNLRYIQCNVSEMKPVFSGKISCNEVRSFKYLY
jgi:hypothetical protein